MGYVDKVLRPDERIIRRGRLHWTIYVRPALFFILGCAAIAVAGVFEAQREYVWLWASLALILFFCSAVDFIKAFIERWTTELAVTDRRVIVKTGLIRRDTIEINTDKIESVDIQQSVIGRLLNFGTVTVRGTGIGMNPMSRIDDPLGLRAAIASL